MHRQQGWIEWPGASSNHVATGHTKLEVRAGQSRMPSEVPSYCSVLHLLEPGEQMCSRAAHCWCSHWSESVVHQQGKAFTLFPTQSPPRLAWCNVDHSDNAMNMTMPLFWRMDQLGPLLNAGVQHGSAHYLPTKLQRPHLVHGVVSPRSPHAISHISKMLWWLWFESQCTLWVCQRGMPPMCSKWFGQMRGNLHPQCYLYWHLRGCICNIM